MTAMSFERQTRAAPWSGYVAKSTLVSALAGAMFVLLSAWAGLGALLTAAITCDDTCAGAQTPPGADWTQYSEAVQWTALSVLAAANLAIALAATTLALFGHRRWAGALALLFGAASVLLVSLLNDAGEGPTSYVWFVASALGLITVLAPGRRLSSLMRRVRRA
jgi:hypothetical protein